MTLDRSISLGQKIRGEISMVLEPIWFVASSPPRIWHWLDETLTTNKVLREQNLELNTQLALERARSTRSDIISNENQRLRDLLGGTRSFQLKVRIADIVDVDLGQQRQRVVIGSGASDGVEVGQAVIDDGGMLGQVIETTPNNAVALLVTDPKHAVPAQVVRSGLRVVVSGTGRSDRLMAYNISQIADIRPGDILITSGIGGRFPAGFPVATVQEISEDDGSMFRVAILLPAAHVNKGRQVLLVTREPVDAEVGPAVEQSEND